MSVRVNYMLWMTGSAWISAAAAGLLLVATSGLRLRWFLGFMAVFNGLFAVYWAMMTVVAQLREPER